MAVDITPGIFIRESTGSSSGNSICSASCVGACSGRKGCWNRAQAGNSKRNSGRLRFMEPPNDRWEGANVEGERVNVRRVGGTNAHAMADVRLGRVYRIFARPNY